MIHVHEVIGPAFLATALVNGDLSGLTRPDDLACYHRFIEQVAPWRVVSTKDDEEPWFTWSFDFYGGNAHGGDVVTYICLEESAS